MNRLYNKFNISISPSRLIYDVGKPVEAVVPADKDKTVLREAAKAAADKTTEQLRKAATERGRSNARAAVGETGPRKPTLPALPDKMKGMTLEGDVKNNDNGTVEQTFKFGDHGIPGRIIMPEKPDANKKTTIVFNYVSDPGKSAESEKNLLEQLKKSKTDLGNTVVVTLRTPEGTTTVDSKKVDTMSALMADLERFQADLNKKPKTKTINLARAETVLHMTSAAEGEKVQYLLKQYQTHAAGNDSRVASIAGIIDSDPDKLVESLEEVVKRMETPAESTDQPGTPDNPLPASTGGGGAMGRSGGGGSLGEGTAGAEVSETGTDEDVGTTETPEAQPEDTKVNIGSEELEVNAEGVDKLLILGDSLLEIGQKRVMSHYGEAHVEATAFRGKHISTLHSELKNRGSQLDKLNTKICRGTILVNGGVNDIAAGRTADEVFGHMKDMMEIAKEHKLKIIFCALAPFGDTTYTTLQNGLEQKNSNRLEVNKKLYTLATENRDTVGIIPLDKKFSEGGLAGDEDTNKLHQDVRAGDGLHLSGKGTNTLTEIIVKHLGELKTSKGKEAEPATPAQAPTSAPTTDAPPNKPDTIPRTALTPAKETTPEFYQFATQINQDFIKEGAAPGTTKRVRYNGKEYIAKFTIHNKQARTGRTGTFQATEMYEEQA